MELRPYQEEALEKLDKSLIDRQETSTILALPTGSGKTLVAVKWVEKRFLQNGNKVLWWTHRIELLRQARKEFASECPDIRVTEWTADHKDESGQVVLAMILSSRDLQGQYGCCVIDEGHHGAMPTYRAKREELDFGFTLLLTATPTRANGKKIGAQSIAAQHSVMDLATQGYLAQPVYVRVRTGQRYRMRANAGDFSQRSLSQLNNLERNQLVAKTWSSDWERWGKILCFAGNIEHAEALERAMLNELHEKDMPKISSQDICCVHSQVQQYIRKRRTRRFRLGKQHQVLINVGIFIEGFDCPDVNTIFMARPTASESLYLQMIGRGTRTAEDKDKFYVVDFVDQLGRYSLLAQRWSMEHLGAEEDVEEVERQQRRWDMARASQQMSQAGMPLIQVRNVLKEFIIFAGIVEFWTRTSGRREALAMTEDLWLCWQKLQVMLQSSRRAKEAISGAYALTGANECGITLARWKNLGWATLFQSKGRTESGWTRFAAFKKLDLDHERMGSELDASRELSHELNMRWGHPAEAAKLLGWLNEYLHIHMGLSNFGSMLEYSNQVITLRSPFHKGSLLPAVRGRIRDAIIQYASAQLDAGVSLVLHWS